MSWYQSGNKNVEFSIHFIKKPLEFWQNYLINWIQASRGFSENAIKANEYWFKAFWEPWLRSAGETKGKVE